MCRSAGTRELGGGFLISTLAPRNVEAVMHALGVATFAEYATGTNFGIDQLMFVDLPGAVSADGPGRIGLKALDSKRPIRESDIARSLANCSCFKSGVDPTKMAPPNIVDERSL
jgi:hypothetical protein